MQRQLKETNTLTWNTETQNAFIAKLEQLTLRKHALAVKAHNEKAGIGEGDKAKCGGESVDKNGDAVGSQGLTEQGLIDVALAVCAFLGLANASVFLLEQKARVGATLQGKAAEVFLAVIKKRGLDLNRDQAVGSTPLHLAAIGGHPDIVALLCQFGADPCAVDGAGCSPAQVVSQCSQTKCVCVCNMVWSFGCRTERTRSLLRQVWSVHGFRRLTGFLIAVVRRFFGANIQSSRPRCNGRNTRRNSSRASVVRVRQRYLSFLASHRRQGFSHLWPRPWCLSQACQHQKITRWSRMLYGLLPWLLLSRWCSHFFPAMPLS